MDRKNPQTFEAAGDRTYTVTEFCPHCESEIEMRWNTDTNGYKAFCPVCGKRLMLCDECRHSNCENCDYCSDTDSCMHDREMVDPEDSAKQSPPAYAVVFTYSHDTDAAAYLFDDRDKASEFLIGSAKQMYAFDTDEQEWDTTLEISEDGDYAKITDHFDEKDDVKEVHLCSIYP